MCKGLDIIHSAGFNNASIKLNLFWMMVIMILGVNLMVDLGLWTILCLDRIWNASFQYRM